MEENKQNLQPPFEAESVEKIMAFAMIPLAYIYVCFMFEEQLSARILMGVFTVAFIVYGEVMFYKRKRSAESILFMVMTLIIGASYVFEAGSVWEEGHKYLFLHLYAVYWVMCRSGCLVKEDTSSLFPFDGFNGFFKMPFGNFLLNPMTIISCFEKKDKEDRKKIGIVFAASAVGIILLIAAIAFLAHSDENFDMLVGIFKIDFNWEYIFRFIICLLVAAYLYGLIGGCYRTKRSSLNKVGDSISEFVNSLRRVPTVVWVVFIVLFSVIYSAYYILQGSYIFDAFGMILPEKYTFSQYARKGFGDMIAVMIINFALLWISERTSERKTRPLLIADTILVIESIMFAVIAFLKLLMYIQAYGFTPLRLQSVWLVLVLTYACVCILISMYTGRKTVDKWFIGSAAALCILTWV